MSKYLLAFIICGVICVAVISSVRAEFIPVGIKRMFHMMTMPDDLFDPIVKDTFHFWEKGFTRTYKLEPKYSDLYMIGIVAENRVLSVNKYKFIGKVKVEYYKEGVIFDEQVISCDRGGVVFPDNYDYYKKVYLAEFPFSVSGKYKKDISMKVTVIEPDEYLEQFKDSVKLYVGVSGRK